MLDSFVVCDLETTGLSPRQHEIIEVGLVRVEGGQIKATFHSLVRPRQKLPVGIRRLTGLTGEQLRESPELPEVLPPVLDFLRDFPLVGHNIGFDREFLEAAAGWLPNPAYDTLELARMIVPFSPGYRLSDLCRFLGIENQAEHRALSDALATVELCRRLQEILRELDPQILYFLSVLLQRAGSAWAAPLSSLVAAPLAGRGAPPIKIDAFFNGPAPAEVVEEEPAAERKPAAAGKRKVSPGPDELPSLLAPQGPLAAGLPHYEYRPQQKEMVAAIVRALNEKKHLVMEAGTGSGKSLAYLLPAVHRALTGNERVVVATNTINLQAQLWEKDLPALTGALSWPVKAVLVKGRQNYLCRRRWQSAVTADSATPEEAAFWARTLVWATRTKTGDRAELNLNFREQEFWALVCADSEGCLGALCPWSGRCYVSRARKAAEAAELIVTNHSLLFSDLRSENKLLPAYNLLVIDEAHHLEDVATEQLGLQVSWAQCKRWLNGTGRLLARLAGQLPPSGFPDWPDMLKGAQEERQKTHHYAGSFFQALFALVRTSGSRGAPDFGREIRRLPDKKEAGFSFPEAEAANFALAFGNLTDRLEKITGQLEDWLPLHATWKNIYGEALAQLNTGKDLGIRLAFLFNREEEDYVYWVEAAVPEDSSPAGLQISLHAAPVHVGKLVHGRLWEPRETVVLTSATLSVEDDFTHFLERVGLDLLPPERVQTLLVDSPFWYAGQSLLGVVNNVPLQGEVPDEEYFEALQTALTSLIRAAQGKTLVLFTSHRVLQETHRRLKIFCEDEDIYLLAHNLDGSRTRLVEEFRSNERSVLLGAASFWEGVDIPGEALSCVVIVKLPFGVPSIPVVEARLEDLARRGKDGFRHFSLPQAVIRFKQGFGRLIRTMQDRGAVVVLDRRLITKRYGRQFLNSLPLKNHLRGDSAAIAGQVARWLQERSSVAGNRSSDKS